MSKYTTLQLTNAADRLNALYKRSLSIIYFPRGSSKKEIKSFVLRKTRSNSDVISVLLEDGTYATPVSCSVMTTSQAMEGIEARYETLRELSVILAKVTKHNQEALGAVVPRHVSTPSYFL